jgi:hypothetical protein
MSKNKGGSAFPSYENGKHNDGMSLRDYMAAKFAAAWISDCDSVVALVKHGIPDGMSFNSAVADRAYKLADAMLVERDK